MSTQGREPDHIHDLPRVLGPLAALGTIVGSVIGSGIFIVPASVARQTPAMAPIALAWVLGGLFSLAGALTLAELAAMLPRAGGPYVYLREAYGDLPAFLFGWTEFLIIRSGSMATLAAAFSLYFAQIVPAPGSLDPRIWQMLAAVVAIAVVTVVNVLGTRWGGRLQVFGTALKVGALGAMIVLPWVLGKVHVPNLSPVWPVSSKGFFTHFMIGMVGVLWTYDGWVNTSNLAEEIRDPGRNLPRSIIGGVLILITLYLLMTLAYHLVLPMDEIRLASTERGSPKAVSADFFRTLLGAPGGVAISLVVMASTFISLNGNVLAGPRALRAGPRRAFPPLPLPDSSPVPDPQPRHRDPGGLGHRSDGGGVSPDRDPSALNRLAGTGATGLDHPASQAPVRRALHLRHLRRHHFLHAQHHQRLRASPQPARPGPALSHLGLPMDTPDLRCGSPHPAGQHLPGKPHRIDRRSVGRFPGCSRLLPPETTHPTGDPSCRLTTLDPSPSPNRIEETS